MDKAKSVFGFVESKQSYHSRVYPSAPLYTVFCLHAARILCTQFFVCNHIEDDTEFFVRKRICALWQSVGCSAFSPVSLLALTRHGSFT